MPNGDNKLLKNVHGYLIKQGAQVPEDFEKFSSTMDENPEVRENVYNFLSKQKVKNLPENLEAFTTATSLKKKEPAAVAEGIQAPEKPEPTVAGPPSELAEAVVSPGITPTTEVGQLSQEQQAVERDELEKKMFTESYDRYTGKASEFYEQQTVKSDAMGFKDQKDYRSSLKTEQAIEFLDDDNMAQLVFTNQQLVELKKDGDHPIKQAEITRIEAKKTVLQNTIFRQINDRIKEVETILHRGTSVISPIAGIIGGSTPLTEEETTTFQDELADLRSRKEGALTKSSEEKIDQAFEENKTDITNTLKGIREVLPKDADKGELLDIYFNVLYQSYKDLGEKIGIDKRGKIETVVRQLGSAILPILDQYLVSDEEREYYLQGRKLRSLAPIVMLNIHPLALEPEREPALEVGAKAAAQALFPFETELTATEQQMAEDVQGALDVLNIPKTEMTESFNKVLEAKSELDFWQGTAELGGDLLGITPKLMVSGGIVGATTRAVGVAAFETALSQSPKFVNRAAAFFIRGAEEEAKFALAFPEPTPGAGFGFKAGVEGMGTIGQVFNNKYGKIMNKYVSNVLGASLGTTAGMEASETVSALVSTMEEDGDLDAFLLKSGYKNEKGEWTLSDKGKHTMQKLIANGILGFTAIAKRDQETFKEDLNDLAKEAKDLGHTEEAAEFRTIAKDLDEVTTANLSAIDVSREAAQKEGVVVEELPTLERAKEVAKPLEVKPEKAEPTIEEPSYKINGEEFSKEDFEAELAKPEFEKEFKAGKLKAEILNDPEMQTKLETAAKIEEPAKPAEEVAEPEDVTETRKKEWLEIVEKEPVDVDKVNELREEIKKDVIEGKEVAEEFLTQMELPSKEEIRKEAPEVKAEEPVVEEKAEPVEEVKPEEEKAKKVNRLMDLKQSFNKQTTAEREKDTGTREEIIKLASELDFRVEGTDKIDIKKDGESLGRPKEALEKEFKTLEDRSEKTRTFIKDVSELSKAAPETIMGIGMSKKAIEQAVKNIEEGKDTKAARQFIDTMDNFVEQGYVEIRAGKGIDAQWFKMELDEFTGKAEKKEEIKAEELSDEVIESNQDLNELITAVGNKDGSINYEKLAEQIEARPEFLETLGEGLSETEIDNLKSRINEQAEKQREGVEPTPELTEERQQLIRDLEDQARSAKTTGEFQAVIDRAEKLLEAEPKPEEPAKPEEPKIAEDLRKAAEVVRSGKISKLGGFKAGTGFDAVWDTGLEVIATSLEAGADFATAVKNGLDHIKKTKWYRNLSIPKKKEFNDRFEDHVREEYESKREPVETVEGKIPEVAEGAESPVKRVDKMYAERKDEFKKKRNASWSKFKAKVTTTFFDVSGNVKRKLLEEGGEEVVIHKDLIAGTSAKSMMEKSEREKEIHKGLSEKQEELLGRIIESRRTIELDNIYDAKGENRLKSPRGLHKEQHEAYLAELEKSNPEEFKMLSEKADLYSGVMADQLKKMKNAGLLSEEGYESLKEAVHYSPRQFIQHLDPEQTHSIEGKTISVPDSGIKSLKEGSEQSLMHDSRMLMAQAISRTNARIAKNKANQELLKFAKDNPENGLVDIQQPIGKTEAGKAKFAPAPAGKTLLTAMVDGQPRRMLMDNEYASEWIRRDPLINQDLANGISVAFGSSALRFMATGANPAFALTNVPRDVAHVLLLTDVYSPVLPLGFAQLSKDIASVSKDALTRTGQYKDYINEGGGMEFLTQQGRILRSEGAAGNKLSQASQALTHVLGYTNEFSEVVVRLAIRKRSIRNQTASFKKKNDRDPNSIEQEAIKSKATWEARNQMDFSQGGSLVKAMDSFVPYTNASFQGTRVLFRYAGSKPKTFAAKVAQLGAAATGLYLWNMNQPGWDDISDVTKSLNFVITTPLYKVNDEGKKEYVYITIPKSHEQIPIAGMFEGIAEWTQSGKLPFKRTVDDLSLGMPRIPFFKDNPPIVDAITTYESNWDNFRDDKIWKGKKVEEWAEFTKYTPEFWKEAGKLLDMSPERLKRGSEKVTTNLQNNFYTSIGGNIISMVLADAEQKDKDEINKTITNQIMDSAHPLIRRYIKFSNPKQKGDNLERYSIEENTKRKLQNDLVRANIGKVNEKEFHLTLQEDEDLANEDRIRMLKMFRSADRKKGIDFFYTELQFAPSPEVKARAYFDRWVKADEAERKDMAKTIAKMGGIQSARFFKALSVLQKPYVQKK